MSSIVFVEYFSICRYSILGKRVLLSQNAKKQRKKERKEKKRVHENSFWPVKMMAKLSTACHGTDGITIWEQHYWQIHSFWVCAGSVAHHRGSFKWASFFRWPPHLLCWQFATLYLVFSFEYHWQHDIEHSLSNHRDIVETTHCAFCLWKCLWMSFRMSTACNRTLFAFRCCPDQKALCSSPLKDFWITPCWKRKAKLSAACIFQMLIV